MKFSFVVAYRLYYITFNFIYHITIEKEQTPRKYDVTNCLNDSE